MCKCCEGCRSRGKEQGKQDLQEMKKLVRYRRCSIKVQKYCILCMCRCAVCKLQEELEVNEVQEVHEWLKMQEQKDMQKVRRCDQCGTFTGA